MAAWLVRGKRTVCFSGRCNHTPFPQYHVRKSGPYTLACDLARGRGLDSRVETAVSRPCSEPQPCFPVNHACCALGLPGGVWSLWLPCRGLFDDAWTPKGPERHRLYPKCLQMDIYHIWCDLRQGVSDVEFCQRVDNYLGELKATDSVEAYRITRRKLGLGPAELGDFHIMLEFNDLAQLDAAFQRAATRAGAVEGLHQAVNSVVQNFTAALYRDFPDPFRKCGEEKF